MLTRRGLRVRPGQAASGRTAERIQAMAFTAPSASGGSGVTIALGERNARASRWNGKSSSTRLRSSRGLEFPQIEAQHLQAIRTERLVLGALEQHVKVHPLAARDL
jgi:hypothetical protein